MKFSQVQFIDLNQTLSRLAKCADVNSHRGFGENNKNNLIIIYYIIIIIPFVKLNNSDPICVKVKTI